MPFVRRFLATLVVLFATLGGATAHQVDSVELEFLRTENEWRLVGLLDLGYMDPNSRGVDGAPPIFREDVMKYSPAQIEETRRMAEETMRQLLTLTYQGKAVPWRISLPNLDEQPVVLPEETGGWALSKAVISVDALPGPGELEAHWNDDQQSELIIIIEESGSGDVGLLSISSGMSATLLEVGEGEGPEAVMSQPTKTAQSQSWLVSGYTHVLPTGLDHILFIFGLFLLAPRWKPLLLQSLLFTLAHSITLGLAVFGFVSLPEKLVGVLIATSIAWIGIENLFTKKLKPQRLFLVFGFGLLHGLGFAGDLREKIGHLSSEQVILPLISFNVGVELAQVSVLILSFLILWPLRRWTRQFQIAGSVLVALAGLFWMITSLLE